MTQTSSAQTLANVAGAASPSVDEACPPSPGPTEAHRTGERITNNYFDGICGVSGVHKFLFFHHHGRLLLRAARQLNFGFVAPALSQSRTWP